MINNFIRCYWLQAAARGVRSPITADRITDWLVDNKVLSIALGGMYSTYTYTCMCSAVLCCMLYTSRQWSLGELGIAQCMVSQRQAIQRPCEVSVLDNLWYSTSLFRLFPLKVGNW